MEIANMGPAPLSIWTNSKLFLEENICSNYAKTYFFVQISNFVIFIFYFIIKTEDIWMGVMNRG